jgi:hypothetical protein
MSQNQWAVRLALAADREGITYVGQTTSQQKWSVAKATVQRWESGQAIPDEVAEQAIVALCRECKAFDARASESESEEDAPITESRLHDVLVEARRAAFRRRHGDGASDSTGEEPDTTGEGNAIRRAIAKSILKPRHGLCRLSYLEYWLSLWYSSRCGLLPRVVHLLPLSRRTSQHRSCSAPLSAAINSMILRAAFCQRDHQIRPFIAGAMSMVITR